MENHQTRKSKIDASISAVGPSGYDGFGLVGPGNAEAHLRQLERLFVGI